MKVTRWMKLKDAEIQYKEPETVELGDKAEEAVIDCIRREGYKFCGDYHQSGDFGTPILDDRYYFFCSYRYWGDVMARAWRQGDYMDFYMTDYDENGEPMKDYIYPTANQITI